ncbi:MAG: FAD-binding oxidoreductase [Bacteroidia bacterium]|nr:FAD-binding oxidoreductase [Bacteroidia bacterium]
MENNSLLNKKVAIIGGGIAGCTLALRLIEQGIKPIVFDEGKINSSQVAAGLWNPLVFKRLTPTWMANRLLNELFTFYPYWEKQWNTSFFNPLPIYKIINDDEEWTMWKKKTNDPEVYEFINPELLPLPSSAYQQKKGYCKVSKSGFLNIPLFLKNCFNYLQEQNLLQLQTVNYSDFSATNNQLNYKNFDVIIFSQGYKAKDNPFFNQIKFNLCKGDVLTIKAKGLLNDAIVTNEGFVVSYSESLYKVGSTYVWDFTDENPEATGFEKIKEKAQHLISAPFEIVSHQTGVRPATSDRRPVLGIHPQLTNAYIFNGLGAKGIMLSPYFSKQMADFILHGTPINTSINYNRFI